MDKNLEEALHFQPGVQLVVSNLVTAILQSQKKPKSRIWINFTKKLLTSFDNFLPFFSNFTAQSSSLTSLASTLSEGLNESTKRSSVGDQPNAKFASAIIVTDLESNLHDVSARLQSWPSSPKSEWQKNLPVVVLRGATKNYGSKKSPKCVLDKLNMTVKEGCM